MLFTHVVSDLGCIISKHTTLFTFEFILLMTAVFVPFQSKPSECLLTFSAINLYSSVVNAVIHMPFKSIPVGEYLVTKGTLNFIMLVADVPFQIVISTKTLVENHSK